VDELPHAVGGGWRPGDDRLAAHVPLDVARELAGRVVPPAAVLLQRAHDDPVEVSPQRRTEPLRIREAPGRRRRDPLHRADARAGLGRLLLADHPLQLGDDRPAQRRGVEGEGSGQELVEQDAQRVDVASRVDVEIVEARLLGAHVGGRAHDVPHRGQSGALARTLVRRLRDPEVDDLGDRDAVLLGDQHVARLDVPVDDPLLVRVLDRGTDLVEQQQAVPQREVAPVAVAGDRLSPDQLHDEVRPAACRRPRVEDARDPRVVHHGERLPLGVEPRDDLARVHPELDDLERHLAAHRLFLLGAEDPAEASLAEDLDQPVRPDDRSRGLGQTAGIGARARLRLAPRRDGRCVDAGGDFRKSELPLDRRAKLGIAPAGLIEIHPPHVRTGQAKRFANDCFDVLRSMGHARSPWGTSAILVRCRPNFPREVVH